MKTTMIALGFALGFSAAGCGVPAEEEGSIGESQQELKAISGKCYVDTTGHETGACVATGSCLDDVDYTHCIPGRAGTRLQTLTCGAIIGQVDSNSCSFPNPVGGI